MSNRPTRLRNDLLALALLAATCLAAALIFPNNLALLTRIAAIALLVLSLDLVTGYCGIATLGQAALFGTGAYAAGIAAVHFAIIEPFSILAIGMLGGALAGLVSSAIILRGRGLAQLVLSIAFAQLVTEAASKASAITGGSDGLAGIAPAKLFGLFAFDLRGHTAFILASILLLAVFAILRLVTRSPFGLLCRGIKADPVRVRAMGAPVYPALMAMYALSGAVAGLGGALSAISTRVVGLDSLGFATSADALVMLVLGGAGRLYGALIGAVSLVWFEDRISALNPFHWLTLVGVLLIAVVLFAPHGLTGAIPNLRRRARP